MALSNGVHLNGGEGVDKRVDEVFAASPYTTRAITVQIGPNGIPYTVLQAMIDQYPGLQARMDSKQPGMPIALPEVDEDIAHTLIHFIYTKEYHTLGLGGLSEAVRASAEFKRSVLAYCAARLCDIGQLEMMTKDKMEHFVQQISIFDLQQVVSDITGKLPQNEVWFPEHLYRWIKTQLQQNDELVGDEKVLELVGRSKLFDKAVFRSIAEMYSEQKAALKIISGGEAKANGHTDAAPSVPTDTVLESGNGGKGGGDDPPMDVVSPVAEVTETEGDSLSPQTVAEDWSVKPLEAAAAQQDGFPSSDDTPVVNAQDVFENGKHDELAKLESAGKATDSEVEAVRKANKKAKKKGKKKANGEAAVGSVPA